MLTSLGAVTALPLQLHEGTLLAATLERWWGAGNRLSVTMAAFFFIFASQ